MEGGDTRNMKQENWIKKYLEMYVHRIERGFSWGNTYSKIEKDCLWREELERRSILEYQKKLTNPDLTDRRQKQLWREQKSAVKQLKAHREILRLLRQSENTEEFYILACKMLNQKENFYGRLKASIADLEVRLSAMEESVSQIAAAKAIKKPEGKKRFSVINGKKI